MYFSVIREVKGPGGLDSVGVKYGTEIRNRVEKLFSAIVGSGFTEILLQTEIRVNDANMPWWTPQLDFDSKEEVQMRVKEFLNFVRYNEVRKYDMMECIDGMYVFARMSAYQISSIL